MCAVPRAAARSSSARRVPTSSSRPAQAAIPRTPVWSGRSAPAAGSSASSGGAQPRGRPRNEGVRNLSNLVENPISTFLEEIEERGLITESELEAFGLEHDLDADELAELRAELEAREVEIDDRPDPAEATTPQAEP